MTFERIRSIVLLLIVGFIVWGVVGSRTLATMGVELPRWTEVGQEFSSLENRNMTTLPPLAREDIANGSFQKSFDKYLSDIIPMRSNAMLANAEMQRLCIKLANIPLGYNTYPTFFESKVLFNSEERALVNIPTKRDEVAAGVEAFAQQLAVFAQAYPDKRFAVLVVDWPNSSLANTAHDLVSDPWSTDMTIDTLNASLVGVGNVDVIAVTYDNPNEYYRDFFRTDHHWNALGASKAYNMLADKLSLKPFNPHPIVNIDGAFFSGSYSRRGLLPMRELALTESDDFDDLILINDLGESERGSEHVRYASEFGKRTWDDFHAFYYGGTSDVSMITSSNKGSAVLIQDSYGSTLRRALARNYGVLYTDPDMHASTKGDDITLQSRIKRQGVHDVVFAGCTDDYATLTKRLPNYFSLEN